MRRILVTALAVLLSTGIGRAQQTLDIIVYGATGEVGSHIVREALQRGHRVAAVSRDPAQIAMQHPNLSAVRGDLLDKASASAIMTGKDVVVLSVRGVVGDSATPESALQFIAAEMLVDVRSSMGDGAPRLIHVGGSGSLEVEPGVLLAAKQTEILLPEGARGGGSGPDAGARALPEGRRRELDLRHAARELHERAAHR
ncbi:MAG: NAD(P)H-binding protein [Gammaproteobacteria bacterium]|nr:NAD(P)H-binding protein [Gammaproteobacteria bacterium]